MRLRHFFLILILAVSVDLQSVLAQQSRQTVQKSNSSSDAAVDLRVGLISYDKPEEKIRDYRELFEELSEQPGHTVRYKPRFAVGTYADVLDWITRGLVDIAVLSPNAFAETRAWRKKGSGTNSEPEGETDCIYLATEGKAPADYDAWVNDKLKRQSEPGKGRFEYNSLCIVCADSKIKNFDQLKVAAGEGNVQFVFGDPLSASGTIFPMHFLRAHGIDFRKHMEYSFGHSDSVNMILEPPPPSLGTGQQRRERVAFVQDLAVQDTQRMTPTDKRPDLTLIQETTAITGMKDVLLPMEVWVARKDFDKGLEQDASPEPTPKNSERLYAALLDHNARNRWSPDEEREAKEKEKEKETGKRAARCEASPLMRDFTRHDAAALEARITPLHAWARDNQGLLAQNECAPLNGDYSKDPALKTPGMKFPVRFQDIVSLIRHHNKIYKDVPKKKSRLALVLSGGGAKCAYQSGAIAEIEEILRRQDPAEAIDIDLVVGTSGGALNAVPVAAGVTSNQNTVSKLEDTWKNLNALDIIRPPGPVQVLLGVAFAFVYFFAVRVALIIRKRTYGRGFLIWILPLIAGFAITRISPLYHIPFVVSYILFYFAARFLIAWATTRWKSFADEKRITIALLSAPPMVGMLCFLIPARCLRHVIAFPSHFLFYPLLLGSWLFYAALLSVFFSFLIWWLNRRVAAHPNSVPGWAHRLARWQVEMPPGGLLASAALWLAIALSFASFNPGGVFRGPPLEEVVTSRYAEIFADPKDKEATTGPPQKRRERISNLIVDREERHRDLVITGSSISSTSHGPKYFYLPRPKQRRQGIDQAPSYGSRGIEIGTECAGNRLLDVALGSGTIFPVFPSHEVGESCGYPMKAMQLIDGGFAHNTPVEAAVLWGATHIILIGASPETPTQGGVNDPVLVNLMTAFGFLYDQAQMADVNAQEEAAVFTLHPKAPGKGGGPRIGIIDFGPGFANAAFNRGKRDGNGRTFVRQPAKPLFWDTEATTKP